MSTDEARALGAQTTEEILIHYGVKGMKWGVRRSRAERKAARFGGKTERQSSADHIYSRQLKAKKTHELSNQELKALNDRLTQEARLKQLSPSVIDRGHKHVKTTLAMTGTATTVLALRKPAIDLGKQLIKYDQSWV